MENNLNWDGIGFGLIASYKMRSVTATEDGRITVRAGGASRCTLEAKRLLEGERYDDKQKTAGMG
jgi:hypothetical protein